MQIVADRDLPIALDHHVSFHIPCRKSGPRALRATNRDNTAEKKKTKRPNRHALGKAHGGHVQIVIDTARDDV